MLLYKLTKRFDPNTGQEVDPIIKPCGKVCDYTGEVIDDTTLADGPLIYTVKIAYNHSSEPNWYYDDGYNELDNGGVSFGDFSKFIEGPYHFMVNYDEGQYGDNSLKLVKEWLDIRLRGETDDILAEENHNLYSAGTIDLAFRAVRYRTLFRLLKEEKYKLEDFGMLPVEENRV